MSELDIYVGLRRIGLVRSRTNGCEAYAEPGHRALGVFPTPQKAATAIFQAEREAAECEAGA